MFLPDSDPRHCAKHPGAMQDHASTGPICSRCASNHLRDMYGNVRPDYDAIPVKRLGVTGGDAELLRQLYAEAHLENPRILAYEVPA